VQSGAAPTCPASTGTGGAPAATESGTRGGHGCVVIDDGTTTHTFTFTGAVETWTVPTGVSVIEVHAVGAGGGGGRSGGSTAGGGGGYVTGVLTVSPGQQLDVLVGEGGIRMCASNVLPLEPVINRHNYAFGGGGMANGDPGYDCAFAAGGGRSAIRWSGASDDLVTAGGGGGGGYSDAGGAGGGLAGSTGGGCGGAGGTQTEGGATCDREPGTAGIKYGGGWAGYSTTSAIQGSEGGGGGGGYYGGGAAGDNGGGGGGSSYVAQLSSAVTYPGSGASAGIGTPTNNTPPVVDGVLAVGRTVSATGSTWSPGGVSTFQWQVSTDGINFTDVSGATAATYAIKRSGYLRVVETRTTILGSLTVSSTAVVVPVPPTTTTTTSTSTTIAATATTIPAAPVTATPPPTAEPSTPDTIAPATPVDPTTTSIPVDETAAPPTDLGRDDGFDAFDNNDNQPKRLRLTLDMQAGEPAAGQLLVSEAGGLKPGSNVRLEMRSTPVVLGEGPADATGAITFESTIPDSVEPGVHRLILSGTTPDGEAVSATAGFEVDAAGVITGVVPASETRAAVSSEGAIERALAAGKPLYDTATNTYTTGALVVTSVLMLTVLAAGSSRSRSGANAGVVGAPREGSDTGMQRDEAAQGSIESLNTAGLRDGARNEESWGDRSRSWRAPGTNTLQVCLAAVYRAVAPRSTLIGRLLIDGQWVRAMLGSLQCVPLVVALALGIAAGLRADGVFAPSFAVVATIVVLAVVDALAGALAWVGYAVVVIASHGISGWFDLRTLLGLGVLFMGIPLLANHTRPLRRQRDGRLDSVDRFGDYVVAPIIVSFASAGIYLALNGLSGLQLVTTGDANALRWVVGSAIVGRLLLEDMVTIGYPNRLRMSSLGPVREVGAAVRIGTVALKSAVYILATSSFFGLGWHLWLVVVLMAVVPSLDIVEDRLPNSARLRRWFPRGVLRTVIMMFVAVWFAGWVLGADSAPENIKRMMPVLLIPSIVLGLVDLLGRDGGDWPDTLYKRVVGGCLWGFVLAVVVGLVPMP